MMRAAFVGVANGVGVIMGVVVCAIVGVTGGRGQQLGRHLHLPFNRSSRSGIKLHFPRFERDVHVEQEDLR